MASRGGYPSNGKRFAAARVHLNNQSSPPFERVALAKHELRGELPDQLSGLQRAERLLPQAPRPTSSTIRIFVAGRRSTPDAPRESSPETRPQRDSRLSTFGKRPLRLLTPRIRTKDDTGTRAIPCSLMASFDGRAVPARVDGCHPPPGDLHLNLGPMVKFGSERAPPGGARRSTPGPPIP